MRYRKLWFTILLIIRFTDGRENGGRLYGSTPRRSARSADNECDFNLTVMGSGGTLTSPDYPNNYPSNLDCRWLLNSAEPNATLNLRIDFLQIEWDSNCKLDYLQVYLGSSPLAPTLGPFCGTKRDEVLKTNSTKLLLVFHSDPVYEDKGFSIDYFTEMVEDCPRLLTSGSGFLRSPGYPKVYPDNTDCSTRITVDPNKKILLFFDSIDIEYGDNCTFDYVQIFDGPTRNSTLLGQICRIDRNSDILKFESSSNSLLVHFHSDDSVSKKGYRARYSSIDERSTPIGNCLWETADNNGTIASPNYPANYPSNSNCSLWILAPEGGRISIAFDALQLEIEANCSYDYLQIKEGPPSNKKTLGTFCGRGSEPKEVTSTQSEIEIIFHSDDFGEFSGFKMRYWFLRNESDVSETVATVDSDSSELTFNQTPQNATLAVGSSHMLHCSTRYPNAKIRWLKGEKFLAGGSSLKGLKMLANNSLWIQSMDHHLSGSYSCIAVSPEDSITSTAYIYIKNGQDDSSCGIVFRKTPKDSSFAEGEFAHLECLAAGSHIQLSWEKDGGPLPKYIIALSNGYIFMEKVKLEDTGVYSCIAHDTTLGCTRKVSALLLVSKRAKIEEICGKPKIGQPSKEIPHIEHGKIVGGQNTKKGAYPWHVMLWEPILDSFCGGTLLNERWIATAAHCFVLRNLEWERIVIKLGKYDKERQEEHEFKTSIADQSSIIIHPAYKKFTFDNDLALVRLRDHVQFTNYILPACLANRDLGESLINNDASNSKIKIGTVIGWGKLKEYGPSPRYLQEIKLPIVDQNVCLASTNHSVTRNMFCAGYPQEIIGDACQGDSGGPFLMSHQNRWYLMGIVSWGEGCGRANKYGFYTRLPNYLSWIKGIIKS